MAGLGAAHDAHSRPRRPAPVERPLRARTLAAHGAASLLACAGQALATAGVFHLLVTGGATTVWALFTHMLLRFTPAGVIVYAAIAAARLALLHGVAASVRLGAGVGGRGTTAELVVPLARGAP